MTLQEFETVQPGETLWVNKLEITVTGKVFQFGDWFVDTPYGQFNICVCSKPEIEKKERPNV